MIGYQDSAKKEPIFDYNIRMVGPIDSPIGAARLLLVEEINGILSYAAQLSTSTLVDIVSAIHKSGRW